MLMGQFGPHQHDTPPFDLFLSEHFGLLLHSKLLTLPRCTAAFQLMTAGMGSNIPSGINRGLNETFAAPYTCNTAALLLVPEEGSDFYFR